MSYIEIEFFNQLRAIYTKRNLAEVRWSPFFVPLGAKIKLAFSESALPFLCRCFIVHKSAGTPFKAFRTGPNPTFIPANTSLGTLFDNSSHTSSTRDINRFGDCVGISQDASGQTRGFLLLAAQTLLTQATSIGTLGGNASEAYGVNDSRDVVGRAKNAAGGVHGAKIMSGGSRSDLSRDEPWRPARADFQG